MYKVVDHLLDHCASIRQHKNVLILCDNSTRDIADFFLQRALLKHSAVKMQGVKEATRHGVEPPSPIAEMMRTTSLIICLCKFSLAHTRARIDAQNQGACFLSLPLYSWELLNEEALTVDFKAQYSVVKKVAGILTAGSKIHISTPKGTDILLDGSGRVGNACPGFVDAEHQLGSPPDIEVNISPVEDRSEGRVVIDGSITCPELGLLTDNVVLIVKQGRIVQIESRNVQYIKILEKIFENLDSKRRILAECGIGLNPLAKLTGTMLTDEGALGFMHFGFGSNHTVGGMNNVDFHLDFVFGEATLTVDNYVVLQAGNLAC